MSLERHHVVADLLEGYALGELTESERRDVEAHLAGCATCEDHLRELHATFAALAASVAPVTPRPEVRRRVLASLMVSPAVGSTRRPGWFVPGLAAAALIVVVLGALYVSAERDRRDGRDQLRLALGETAELRRRLQRYAGQTDLALSILTAPDVSEIALGGRNEAGSSAARAFWSSTRGLLVVADRLPAPPVGRVYQVWVIAGEPISAGLLVGDTPERGMLIVPPPRAGLGGTVTVAVTDEPPGGLTEPSGTVRLAGSI